jgi:hypothetical protein
VRRRVLAPWWILSLINKSARQSRTCRWLDKKASIRATTRAVDHAYSSTEMDRRIVTSLKDIGAGLRLALRGRVQLRQDLIDYDNPRETMRKVDELSEDLLRNALVDIGNEVMGGWDRTDIEKDLNALTDTPRESWPGLMRNSPALRERLAEIERMGKEKLKLEELISEDEDLQRQAAMNGTLEEEYLISAAEFVLAMAAGRKWVGVRERDDIYMPMEISWGQKGTWK